MVCAHALLYTPFTKNSMQIWLACHPACSTESYVECVHCSIEWFLLLLPPGIWCCCVTSVVASADIPEGTVEFRGADFAWGSRAWAGQPDSPPGDADSNAPAVTYTPSRPTSAASTAFKTGDIEAGGGGDQGTKARRTRAASTNGEEGSAQDAKSDSKYTAPLTLHSPRFTISPGEFVGVAGEVCIFSSTYSFPCCCGASA